MKIKLSEIKKSYSTIKNPKLEILKGINFEILQNEIITIYGPSGAGKSTLLHLVGLIDEPTSGKIYFDETDTSKLSDKEKANFRKNKIGFIFQFHHLLLEFSAVENIMLPAMINGLSKKKSFEKAKIFLDKLGLSDRQNHKPNELSGGEQQRIAIARALVNSPEIILADEPTGNLDSDNSKIVQELLFSLQKELKFSLVIVTHNMEIINSANKLVMMRDGVLQ
ncbi:MAG: ABC transporter ATP-binding protein [Bacteroidota bacterium]